MKNFNLKRVRYKNFMSVGQQYIDINLGDFHKSLITGLNGNGKSSAIEAITYALFNKPYRKIKLGQLVNAYNKKDMLVELWLEYNNKEFYIRRGQKPSVFDVTVDGTKLDENATGFQERFELMIGMNLQSFKQVVVLGTAGYTPFMELDTPKRRKFVEDLLGITQLSDIDKINKENIRDINQDVSTTDMKLNHVETEIKTHLDYQEKQAKATGENLDRLKSMYSDHVSEAKQIKASISGKNALLLDIILPDDKSELIRRIDAKVVEFKTDLRNQSKVLSLYSNGGDCPVCMQELIKSDKIKTIEDSTLTLQSNCDKLRHKRDQLNKLQSDYSNMVVQSSKLNNEIANLSSQLKSTVEKAKRISTMINETSTEVIDNTDKINELSDTKVSILDHKTDLVHQKYLRSFVTEMLKDSGIKGNIISKYIPLINESVNKYLKILGADYNFTLDEEFKETIKSRGRESFSYFSFSQGEKARIDLSLMFTWRNIAEMVSGIKINCLFLDEVFDGSFDADGIKYVNQILNDFKDTNIFVISHRSDQNANDYDQHIKLNKVGRFTVNG